MFLQDNSGLQLDTEEKALTGKNEILGLYEVFTVNDLLNVCGQSLGV